MSWLFEGFVVERNGSKVIGSETAGGYEQCFLISVDMAACNLFDHLSEAVVGSLLDVVVG